MGDLPNWVLVALSAGGAFAGAWGAVRTDMQNLKGRMVRVEKWIDNRS